MSDRVRLINSTPEIRRDLDARFTPRSSSCMQLYCLLKCDIFLAVISVSVCDCVVPLWDVVHGACCNVCKRPLGAQSKNDEEVVASRRSSHPRGDVSTMVLGVWGTRGVAICPMCVEKQCNCQAGYSRKRERRTRSLVRRRRPVFASTQRA